MELTSFQKFGRLLEMRGLNTSHGGNMSRRVNDKIFITRTESMLSDLKPQDILEVGLGDFEVKEASSELETHRAIYYKTKANAIIHAHPPFCIALSFFEDEIKALDLEGRHHLREIPVVGNSPEEISCGFKEKKAVVARKHGIFVIGDSLEKAYMLV
ncbi:MAG: class II aldolase/adducin family protein, partial [Candidatus Methanofastidiosia archaeon]